MYFRYWSSTPGVDIFVMVLPIPVFTQVLAVKSFYHVFPGKADCIPCNSITHVFPISVVDTRSGYFCNGATDYRFYTGTSCQAVFTMYSPAKRIAFLPITISHVFPISVVDTRSGYFCNSAPDYHFYTYTCRQAVFTMYSPAKRIAFPVTLLHMYFRYRSSKPGVDIFVTVLPITVFTQVLAVKSFLPCIPRQNRLRSL